MTLEEVIIHAVKIAEENERLAEKWEKDGGVQYGKSTVCRERVAEQKQIIDLLMELKDSREELCNCGTFIDELIKENKEAKELLKYAMEDMNTLYESGKDEGCINIKFKWRYADRVEKLLK